MSNITEVIGSGQMQVLNSRFQARREIHRSLWHITAVGLNIVFSYLDNDIKIYNML